MKKVILFVLLMPVIASAQLIRDFESGTTDDWIQAVTDHWKADSQETLSGNFSLHHIFDNSTGGNDCIGLRLANLHPAEGTTLWSFKLRHGCDPSSSNSWAVYLMSDTDPAGFADGVKVSGYAVGVNLSGYDDTLRLWKIKEGVATKVVTCPLNWQTNIGTAAYAEIAVKRTSSGIWNLSVRSNSTPAGIASGHDGELFSQSWFVLNYKYTSTRDRLLWFDDLNIEGVFYEDITPPGIIECFVTGQNTIDLVFNEQPSSESVALSNYSLSVNPGNPLKIEQLTSCRYRIVSKDNFINKQPDAIVIKNLCDRNGNCAERIVKNFLPAWAETGDVIISEIMADPVPVVSLPAREYIEIFNRTGFSFNMEGWSLSAEDQKWELPSVKLGPGEFMIICSAADTVLFSGYGKTCGIKSFPVLADDGKLLALYDSLSTLIHGVDYSATWYGNELKKSGGWSLEMIDTEFSFFGNGNWEASADKAGGTPGRRNSASRSNPDRDFEGLTNVFPIDKSTVKISFSEPQVYISQQPEKMIIEWKDIENVRTEDLLFRDFILKTSDEMKENEILKLVVSPDITDFAGNAIHRNVIRFGLPGNAVHSDIVFNELLFNPYPDEPDYIEFYNLSDKIINASQLYLASVNTVNGDTSEIKAVSEAGRCILPGSYFVITTDRDKITDRYISSDPEAVLNVASLPSMPDDRGHLLLLNRGMELIDEVVYSDDMHYTLLAGSEGISLEKIRPDLNSGVSSSWHSASESSGWGTPGRENSVFSMEPSADERIKFSSGRISPDNDGYQDILVLDLDLEGPGNVISVTVFDETGSYVRKICRNYLAGNKASLVWDGTADDNSLVRSGIYIILIELYNDKGKIRTWKRVCTVIR